MLTCAQLRQPEAHVEALDKQSEVAPHVQDDFDIPEEDLKDLDPRDQQENQVQLQLVAWQALLLPEIAGMFMG